MPKTSKINESRIIEACDAAQAEEKPNITKIAREYGVPRTTLYDRVKKGTPTWKPINKAFEDYQEKPLIYWATCMRDWNMPVTPNLLQAWANRALVRAGKPNQQVSKMWAYRFIKRLPPGLDLGPVKQKTKESKRIQAEDAGFLTHQYNQLEILLRGIPARLVYNLDEYGFQPGEGKSRKVLGSRKRSCPDLAESERGENITAVECIAADGWNMDPLFIFKSGGIFMENWFYESEGLPPHATITTSPNGWISDELALGWLQYFIEATNSRTKRGEKRILIFDGHGSHLTVEFLQKCEDNNIIPFGFLPHTTHLCQPLDGKPFLSYKQQFRSLNNELSFWAGKLVGNQSFYG